MNENVTIMTVLEELREFRAENNKRWEENDRRWEQNEKRWEENDRRWEQNEKRWEENDRRWEANDKKMDALDARVSRLEEARKTDRIEIIEVLDTMQKSIDKQFTQIRDYMDIQFDKINAINTVNQIEHKQFREAIKNLAIKSNFQNSRITALEEWKDKFEDGIIGVC